MRERVKEGRSDLKRSRGRQRNQKEFDWNEEKEGGLISRGTRKRKLALSCAVNPCFLISGSQPKKRVMGVCLMITRLLQRSVRSAPRLPKRISQIRFQSWRSLRRSAVSSVMAPQTSEAPTPLRDIWDLTSLRWKMNIVCHTSYAASRPDGSICHGSNQPSRFFL